MEVYAAMVDRIDQNVGRLVDALEELDELDNTIIIFLSDNGASREGEVTGTTAYYVHLLQGDDIDADYARLDDIGGPRTTPHYPRGWAMASGTPFRLYKINTHQGGHSVPFCFSWPAGLPERGAIRTQYAHVTDLLPTLLELIGVERPTERNGVPLAPIDGASFAATLRDPDAPSAHLEQIYECNGHRGLYRDGWELVTLHQPLTPFTDQEWELYHLAEDPTELHDLAAAEPERVRELAAAWEEGAWNDHIYPLDEGTSIKYVQRPDRRRGLRRAGHDPAGYADARALALGAADLVPVDHDHRRPGPQVGGPGNARRPRRPGRGLRAVRPRRRAVLRAQQRAGRDADGLGRRDGRRRCNPSRPSSARPAARSGISPCGSTVRTGPCSTGVPMLFGIAPFEGIDVGIDRRSPVSWEIYERFGPFPYTGALHSVTYTPG